MRTPPPFAGIEDRPVRSDEQLLERVSFLLEAAARRQIWLMFLDDRSLQLPILIPSEIPRRPRRGDAGNLERRGSDSLSETDRAWLALAARACQNANAKLRGPLLCHDGGLRWIGPEDLGTAREASGAIT